MGVLPVEEDAKRVFEAMKADGVAIIPLDVAYGIFGMTAAAVERIFQAKARSYSKPSGTLGNLDILEEVAVVGPREREIVEAVTVDYGLPMSVVAPIREGNDFLANAEPEAVARSTKGGTIDVLLNAGPLHAALTRLSHAERRPLMGSSANRSLSGSKFRLADVEPEVRAAAAIEIDYGLCRYANPEEISSTIVDLSTFEVHRFGVCYAQVRDILSRHFRIELPPKPDARLVTGAARGEERADA